MASQFQNRLVGTVILVALVVIFLPDLLDGNKQQQREDDAFAKIPLRPELAPAKPALQVSGGADLLAAAHQQSQAEAQAAEQLAPSSAEANQWQVEPIAEPVTAQQTPPKADLNPVSTKAEVKPKSEVKAKPEPKPVPKPEPKPKPTQLAESKPKVVEPPKPKSVDPLGDLVANLDKPKPASPSQGAWIIQVGAFKNADSVNHIVAKLRAAGIPAHSIPRTPRQGSLNRVVVGPDVSRDKLQAMLPKLRQLTALSGTVVAYNP